MALSQDNAKKPTWVTCPQCKSKSIYSADNPFRPFCCEKCSLIDLGEWASEGYRIPKAITPEDLI